MTNDYLDILDSLLIPPLQSLSRPFIQSQLNFLSSLQHPDGGFPGRQGPSDLYYTDFALRILTTLAPDHPAIPRAAHYLSLQSPTDLIASFNLLNSARLLQKYANITLPLDTPSLTSTILSHLLPTGGFSRSVLSPLPWERARVRASQNESELHDTLPVPHTPSSSISAYYTFLATLSLQSLHLEIPLLPLTIQSLISLQQPDGGFSDTPHPPTSQTNSTAAALALLSMHDNIAIDDITARASNFLLKMESPTGGFLAHPSAPAPDLLSTFTALLTLFPLDAFSQINLPNTARFLRSCASPTGGFLASPSDDHPDIEYTSYALNTLSILSNKETVGSR